MLLGFFLFGKTHVSLSPHKLYAKLRSVTQAVASQMVKICKIWLNNHHPLDIGQNPNSGQRKEV